MSSHLKKRVITSSILLLILFLMLIDNIILSYFLIITGIYSLMEFFSLIQIIYRNNKIIQTGINLIFVAYIFFFCNIFFIFSNFFHLKIIMFLILITCVFSDIGGFIFGKTFKGPKLTKISPKKTIYGSLGSIIFSIFIFSVIMTYITKNFDFYFIIVALITSISSQLGDLFFSFLKRKSSVKDTGNFLPGHGGILDRIDGILLGLPLGFLSLLLFY